MKLTIIPLAKALNKAYLKQSLKREQIELFKDNLSILLDKINEKESEEHLKNLVADFLKGTWYKQTNEVNTSGRADLAIYNGKSSSDTVGVLIEVKRPGGSCLPDCSGAYPAKRMAGKPNIEAYHLFRRP